MRISVKKRLQNLSWKRQSVKNSNWHVCWALRKSFLSLIGGYVFVFSIEIFFCTFERVHWRTRIESPGDRILDGFLNSCFWAHDIVKESKGRFLGFVSFLLTSLWKFSWEVKFYIPPVCIRLVCKINHIRLFLMKCLYSNCLETEASFMNWILNRQYTILPKYKLTIKNFNVGSGLQTEWNTENCFIFKKKFFYEKLCWGRITFVQ